MSSFDSGIKGMNTQNAAIQVASNNIANANTVGYKARQSLFVDEYFKAAPTGEDAGTRRDAAQGAMKATSSALDLAVQGNGMFCLTSQVSGDTASSTYYSRNGSFAVNKDGYIVNANGLFLNGYQPNATRTGATNTVGALMMPPATKSRPPKNSRPKSGASSSNAKTSNSKRNSSSASPPRA
jgi:flagellar hook protein FlgE